jgi:SAM-dependent methyltransferase
MRKIYQNGWHGIVFEEIITISSTQIAGELFYKTFYQEFFNRYRNWDDLNPEWVRLKLQTVELLKDRMVCGKKGKILSIGCGIGIVERALIIAGYENIELTEVSEDPLHWVVSEIPQENIHLGFFPDCIPQGRLYDFIYLLSVEYFFDQQQLIIFLRKVKERLSWKGICLLISYNLEKRDGVPQWFSTIKEITKLVLEKLNMRSRGQFWGYARTRKEFHQAMEAAGFNGIVEGILGKETSWDTYWIEGR